ncbi:MAG: cytidylate kinase-like family protein [bacterium]|nr:cytidylate kinase-like family protein [bacterium]
MDGVVSGSHGHEVEFQMRFREILDRVAEEGHLLSTVEKSIGPYLTLSRQPFSGGATVAQGVGERLGWSVLDREIVDILAQDLKVSPQLLNLVDETKSNWFRDDVLSLLESRLVEQDEYVAMVGRVVQLAACDGRVVIVGRGANFLLPPQGGLRVRVIAPKADRLTTLCEIQGVDRAEGLTNLAALDAARAGFLNRHFGLVSGGVHGYDLVIDTSCFGTEGCVEIIVAACEQLELPSSMH